MYKQKAWAGRLNKEFPMMKYGIKRRIFLHSTFIILLDIQYSMLIMLILSFKI